MPTVSERIKAKNRSRRNHTLKVLLVFIVIVSTIIGLWQLIHRPDFSFGQIKIRGTAQLTVEDILTMDERKQPVNLLLLDTDRVEEGLVHDIRFQQAKTSYAFPNILWVEVVERKPALYLQNAHKNYVMLDYQGLVMDVTSGIPSDNAPMLVGKQCGDLYIGDIITDQELLGLLGFLDTIGPEAADQFAAIEVKNDGQVCIQLRDGLDIIFANLTDVPSKAAIFTAVYNEIKDKQLAAKFIDFTYKKPYVKVDNKLMPKQQGVNR